MMIKHVITSAAFALWLVNVSSCINESKQDSDTGNIDCETVHTGDSVKINTEVQVLTREMSKTYLCYILDTLAVQNLKFTIEEFGKIQQVKIEGYPQSRKYDKSCKPIWSFDENRSEIFLKVTANDTSAGSIKLKLVFCDDSIFVFSLADVTAFYLRNSNSFFICRSRTFDKVVTSKNIAAIYHCDAYLYPYCAVKFHHNYSAPLKEICYYEKYTYDKAVDNNFYAKAKSDSTKSRTTFMQLNSLNLVKLFNEIYESEMEYEVVFPNGAFFNTTPMWWEPFSVIPFIKFG